MSKKAILMLVLLAIPATAKSKRHDNGRSACQTTYSVIVVDSLGNTQAKISDAKTLNWVNNDLEKKYPDVCYAEYRDPSTDSSPITAFFTITVKPATYYGESVVTSSAHTPTSGTNSRHYGTGSGHL